jgi:hypothetical protein
MHDGFSRHDWTVQRSAPEKPLGSGVLIGAPSTDVPLELLGRAHMTRSGYPNVHLRLHLTQCVPDNPPRKNEIEVWLKDTRFRVRELTGRRLDEILADATEPRQLGAPPRAIANVIDRAPPTELYGDLETDEGWVYRLDRPRAPVRAAVLAPVAEQILADGKASGLEGGRPSTRLGRSSIAYRGQIHVSANGEQFHNTVIRVISPPYVLLDDTHNTRNTEQAYMREVTALEEGIVTDAEVTPPGGDYSR